MIVSELFSSIFPGKVQKIALDPGLGCPGRCSFCNGAAFSPAYTEGSIREQLDKGIRFFARKGSAWGYLAYFQAGTGTFGPGDKLISLYEEALAYPGVAGLVIATRPDCISADLAEWFCKRFGSKAPEGHPFLLVELGIESTLDRTLERIGRGHGWECSKDTIRMLDSMGVAVGAHLIIGLPGEDENDFIGHAKKLSELPIKTLKLHQLQIIKGTAMARQYMTHPEEFELMSARRYARIVAEMMKVLRKDIAIDRLVSESPRDMVLAPCWNLKPSEFAALLQEYM